MARAKKKLVKKSRLTKLMQKKNITQYRLAKLLKVTPSTVAQWQDKYNPDAFHCAQLMALLNCTIWDLLHQFETEEVTEEDDLEAELEKRLKELL